MSAEIWFDAADLTEVPVGGMKGIQFGGAHIALFNLDGEIFATSNICTHAFAFLTDGFMEDKLIECPLHAGQFDVRTGKGQGAPISCDLRTYPARVSNGRIEICIE